MKKYIEINGGGWSDVLKKVIKIYNNLPNRSTDMKPIDAVKGGDDVIKKLKESVKETQDDEGRTPPKVYEHRRATAAVSPPSHTYRYHGALYSQNAIP